MANHQVNIELSQSVPTELEAGADIILNVKVSCREGCDLRSIPVNVMAADEVVITRDLAAFREAINETEGIALKAPEQVGEHVWKILFRRHETEATVHEESCLDVAFTTKPHATSMAVWDVPSPVVVNRPFKVKVGVKCSMTCQLAGQVIEICDEAGIRIGDSALGETPWAGTSALYAAEVELTAPATEGVALWSARFSAASGLPHEDASAAFSIRAARPPEHHVTVKVIDKETNAPVENVAVRLGIYRASTDSQGLATLELPGGVYELDAWKVGYATVPGTVEVSRDLTIQVAASFSPEQDPDDQRVWM
jgi:hypothetical protein